MTAWVGLTGGIGSGKSQTAACFARFGVPVIDADALSRSLTAPGGAALPHIRAVFGDILFEEAVLKRDALRDLVFRQPEARKQLEALMFPLILRRIVEEKQQIRAGYGIIEIPLLVENPEFMRQVDRILVVDVPEELQIRRLAERNLSADNIRRIMAAQASRAQRREAADDILTNSGTIEELAEKTGRLKRFYEARFPLKTTRHPT